MNKKKQLKKFKKWLEQEIRTAKTLSDNGCFAHDSLKEEVRAKTHYETLKSVALKLIELRQKDPF